MSQEPELLPAGQSGQPDPSQPAGTVAERAGTVAEPAGTVAERAGTVAEPAGAVAEPPGPPSQHPVAPQLTAVNADASEPQPAPPSVRPAGRRRWSMALGIASGVAAVGAVAAVGFLAVSMLGEDLPAVGDCMTDSATVADMAVIDCAAADAYWLVVGHDGSWTHGEFESAQPGEVCARFPSTLQALWVSDQRTATDDTQGEVVCLEPLNTAE